MKTILLPTDFSDNAKNVWKYELEEEIKTKFKIYSQDNFFTPFASGSSEYNNMIICPCSMGSMAKIANGLASDLLSRAADVILKERGKLVLLTREMPYNLVHIENMKKITLAGGIICPASPSFYHHPKTIEELVDTVIIRALKLLNIKTESKFWGK
ncbi:MAG: 3-octaprenyl-4-hydroxybenzoate carboxy-lyase [Bacteroidetes bacterium HGW-Bacteroidetes-12]|nr:MAG: 3-octaprenyl-4-hydroxybenzoate carboxy-lyase [Bacteroidetes bacterium HGW-Bacteroidetes-12]